MSFSRTPHAAIVNFIPWLVGKFFKKNPKIITDANEAIEYSLSRVKGNHFDDKALVFAKALKHFTPQEIFIGKKDKRLLTIIESFFLHIIRKTEHELQHAKDCIKNLEMSKKEINPQTERHLNFLQKAEWVFNQIRKNPTDYLSFLDHHAFLFGQKKWKGVTSFDEIMIVWLAAKSEQEIDVFAFLKAVLIKNKKGGGELVSNYFTDMQFKLAFARWHQDCGDLPKAKIFAKLAIESYREAKVYLKMNPSKNKILTDFLADTGIENCLAESIIQELDLLLNSDAKMQPQESFRPKASASFWDRFNFFNFSSVNFSDHPDDYKEPLNQAINYFKKEQWKAGIDKWDEAKMLNPTLANDLDGNILFLASAAFSLHDVLKREAYAKELLLQAFKKPPKKPEFSKKYEKGYLLGFITILNLQSFNLSDRVWDQKTFSDMISLRHLTTNPIQSNSKVNILQAKLLEKDKQYWAAIGSYTDALNYDCYDLEAWTGVNYCLAQNAEYDEVLDVIQTVIIWMAVTQRKMDLMLNLLKQNHKMHANPVSAHLLLTYYYAFADWHVKYNELQPAIRYANLAAQLIQSFAEKIKQQPFKKQYEEFLTRTKAKNYFSAKEKAHLQAILKENKDEKEDNDLGLIETILSPFTSLTPAETLQEAWIFCEEKRWEKAEQTFTYLEATYPKTFENLTSDSFLKIANAYLECKKPTEAKKFFLKAHKTQQVLEWFSSAIYQKLFSMVNKELSDKIEAATKKDFKENKKSFKFNLEAGDEQIKKEHYLLAARYYDEAIKKVADNYQGYLGRHYALLRENDPEITIEFDACILVPFCMQHKQINALLDTIQIQFDTRPTVHRYFLFLILSTKAASWFMQLNKTDEASAIIRKVLNHENQAQAFFATVNGKQQYHDYKENIAKLNSTDAIEESLKQLKEIQSRLPQKTQKIIPQPKKEEPPAPINGDKDVKSESTESLSTQPDVKLTIQSNKPNRFVKKTKNKKNKPLVATSLPAVEVEQSQVQEITRPSKKPSVIQSEEITAIVVESKKDQLRKAQKQKEKDIIEKFQKEADKKLQEKETAHQKQTWLQGILASQQKSEEVKKRAEKALGIFSPKFKYHQQTVNSFSLALQESSAKLEKATSIIKELSSEVSTRQSVYARIAEAQKTMIESEPLIAEAKKKELTDKLKAQIAAIDQRLIPTSTTTTITQLNIPLPETSLKIPPYTIIQHLPKPIQEMGRLLIKLQQETKEEYYLLGGALRQIIRANEERAKSGLETSPLQMLQILYNFNGCKKNKKEKGILLNDIDIATSVERTQHRSGLKNKYTYKKAGQSNKNDKFSKMNSEIFLTLGFPEEWSIRHNENIRLKGLVHDCSERDNTASGVYGKFVEKNNEMMLEIYNPPQIINPEHNGYQDIVDGIFRFIGSDEKEIETRLVHDPIQIIRCVYQSYKAENGQIPTEDLDLIKKIFHHHPKLFEDKEDKTGILLFWINEKINKLDPAQSSKCLNELEKLGIAKTLSDKANKQFGFKLPAKANEPFGFRPPTDNIASLWQFKK